MNLFKRKKSCFCGGNCTPETIKDFEIKKAEEGIKVLGSGCIKCTELEKNVKLELDELGLSLNIEHITDYVQISSYGVMSTPALVLDGKVVSYGKVLTIEEVKEIIKEKR